MRLRNLRHDPSSAIRLFCFPYGGGGVSVFQHWPQHLPERISVSTVEVPGRDSLIAEAPIRDLSLLVERVFDVIVPHLDRPFVLFGHSLGAIVAFELCRLLRTRSKPQPLGLVVSGHIAPHVRETRAPVHDLPREAFVRELKRLDGTPPEVLANRELMDLLIPALRADFELNDTYVFRPEEPLEYPIIAFAGLHDNEAEPQKMEHWRQHGNSEFAMHVFEGGHFFLNSMRSEVLRTLRTTIEENLERRDSSPLSCEHDNLNVSLLRGSKE